jgi:hypothetical protein
MRQQCPIRGGEGSGAERRTPRRFRRSELTLGNDAIHRFGIFDAWALAGLRDVWRPHGRGRYVMSDLLYLALGLAFFGLSWGFVKLCEKV